MRSKAFGDPSPKCSLACQYCRIKKAKCSGTRPCSNCVDRQEECWFPPPPTRMKPREAKDKALDDRFARLEALLQASIGRNPSPQEVQFPPVDLPPSQQPPPQIANPQHPSKYPAMPESTSLDVARVDYDAGSDTVTVIHDKTGFQPDDVSAYDQEPFLTRSAEYPPGVNYGANSAPVAQNSDSDFSQCTRSRSELHPESASLQFFPSVAARQQPARQPPPQPQPQSQSQPQISNTRATPDVAVSQAAVGPSTSSQTLHTWYDQHIPPLPELEPAGKRARTESLHTRPTHMDRNVCECARDPAASEGGTTLVDTVSTVATSDQATEDSPPTRYLSIFSQGAMNWMAREIGTNDFISGARKFAADLGRDERLGQTVKAKRVGDPDYDTAMAWSNAYFCEGLHSVYGVVDVRWYQARLRDHYANTAKDDAPWYALRNTIFATGCRIVLGEDDSPKSFSGACAQGWQYFENALSVHTDLVYFQTNIMAIQALLLMAFYSEALGSPALEYMLVSNAVRLAQSKGLHLRSRNDENVGDDNQTTCAWLWWAIYAYDKHLAYRSGRPSAIDDDDISCPIPISAPGGSTMSLEFFQITIRHAKLSSHIAKSLSTVKAQEQTSEQLMLTVGQLLDKLEEWRASLPSYFTAKPPFKNVQLPSNLHLSHVVYLHFCYWSSVIAIHTSFCYPWSRGWREETSDPRIILQRQQSTKMVAEASRQMIRATQSVHTSAASPVWLTFYFPLIGLTNLFIYVIKNPHLPTVPSDISLMEVVVGHFGYLEYASASELSFPFPRQLVGFARKMYDRSRDADPPQSQPFPEPTKEGGGGGALPPLYAFSSNMASLEFADAGIEQWPSFLPSFSGIAALTRQDDPYIGDFDIYLNSL